MKKLLIILIVLTGFSFLIFQAKPLTTDNIPEIKEEPEIENTEPIDEFKERINKKPFGIFITPETSPVQPERFSGYHTGVDVEYEDIENEVSVFAIADGLVKYSGWVSGYGGLLAIQHTVNEKEYLAIYGHLNPDSLVEKDEKVVQGQQIGILGEGNTNETDFERKHLHFAIYSNSDINLKGYVNNESELNDWIDPEIFLEQK